MKFTVLQSNLKQNLAVVGHAINSRTPLPVLNNILIKTEKGRLKLTASDLQVVISTYLGAKIDQDGAITVPARLLSDFVNQITDKQVNAELKGNILKLITEKTESNFSGIPATEFPENESAKGNSVSIDLSIKELNEAASKINFAAAIDEGRPVLTGLYIKAYDKTLLLAATDGFRMAEYRLSLNKKIEKSFACIVPAKSFSNVLKSFFNIKTDGNLKFYFNEDKNMVVLELEDMEAAFRTIDGEYPEYQSVVPASFTTTVDVSKDEFSSSIKLVSVFAKDMGYAIKLKISDKGVTVSSQPTESGSNFSKMESKVVGEDIEIGFNARYLIDFVNNVDAENLTIKVFDSLKPGMITEKGKDNYWYIVMPMKSNW